MTLKELRQQRSQKATRGKAALTEYNTLAAKETRTAEEDTTLAALVAELEQLEAAVDDLDGKIAVEESAARRGALFATGARQSAGSTIRTSEPNPATTGGFNNLAEMAMAVRNAVVNHTLDPRLASTMSGAELAAAPANFHQNQGAAGEGFLVPVDFRTTIWELAFDPTDLLGMITPEPTNSNAVSMPADETTPWGAAGVQAYWRAEGAQMAASKTAVNQKMVQLNELYAFVLATDEVLSDAPRLQNRLTNQAARAIRWKASDAVMWGDGNGKPMGYMNSSALVTVSKESGQAAATVVLANLLKMVSRVLRNGGRPLWVINSDVLPQIAALTLGNVPAWLPNQQPLQASPFEGSLLGYPVLFSEHAQTLGTLGDISCVDLNGYFAATKAGGVIDFASSIHLYFDFGMQAFRWTFRLGGQPYLAAPVTPNKGTNTKSHFVTLEAR